MSTSGELSIPRWLMPAELAGEASRRRTVRDWCVDLALFTAAMMMGAWELSQPEAKSALYNDELMLIDMVIGFAACVALWWRRRIPLILLWLMVPLQFAWSASGAVMVAVLTAAVHRPWRPVVLAVGVQLAIFTPSVVAFEAGEPVQLMVVAVFVFFLLPMLWGMNVRGRRQQVVGLRREQSRLMQDARQAERRRIAREMHDTLAHQLSVMSVHAGALEYRTGTDPHNLDTAQLREAVGVIQDSAQRANIELGEVLSLLRAEDGDHDDVLDGEAGLVSRLGELADESRTTGQQVTLTIDRPEALDDLKPRLRRTVYRVVQEGVTNARKHAPGNEVTAHVSVTNKNVTIDVGNRLGDNPNRAAGFGLGLTGLHERVTLEGGTLRHSRTDGHFTLQARIPLAT